MESRLRASPSSHLQNMSQEERLEFSIFLVGLKQALELASRTEQRKARSRRETLWVFFKQIYLYQVKLSVSLNQHW